MAFALMRCRYSSTDDADGVAAFGMGHDQQAIARRAPYGDEASLVGIRRNPSGDCLEGRIDS